MNIVYGGSFNPPTIAHKKIIDILFTTYNPENIIVLPVSCKYHKDGLIDDFHRFKMLELLDKRIVVSDLELYEEFHGTYASLKKLKEKYADIYYVIGADNIIYLSNWINFDNLIREFKFIVMGRNDINVLRIINDKYEAYRDRFIFIDININVSSSSYRKNKDESLLTKEVNDYIIQNHLYEG